MTIDELKTKYGCVDCAATNEVVAKYNKVDAQCSAAIKKAMKELEAASEHLRMLENDKIGLKN